MKHRGIFLPSLSTKQIILLPGLFSVFPNANKKLAFISRENLKAASFTSEYRGLLLALRCTTVHRQCTLLPVMHYITSGSTCLREETHSGMKKQTCCKKTKGMRTVTNVPPPFSRPNADFHLILSTSFTSNIPVPLHWGSQSPPEAKPNPSGMPRESKMAYELTSPILNWSIG